MKNNIFDFFNINFDTEKDENIYNIFESKNIKIERIVSWGQSTPNDFWYNQPHDEWILLLNGEACIAYDDNRTFNIRHGDYMLIPAFQKHKVTHTSSEPKCVWLAIHLLSGK